MPSGIMLLKDKKCYRSACQVAGVLFWNTSTKQWYCPDCGIKINEQPGQDGLCIPMIERFKRKLEYRWECSVSCDVLVDEFGRPDESVSVDRDTVWDCVVGNGAFYDDFDGEMKMAWDSLTWEERNSLKMVIFPYDTYGY